MSRVEGILSRVEGKMSRIHFFVTRTFQTTFPAGYNCSIKLDCSTPPIYTLHCRQTRASMLQLIIHSFTFNILAMSSFSLLPRLPNRLVIHANCFSVLF